MIDEISLVTAAWIAWILLGIVWFFTMRASLAVPVCVCGAMVFLPNLSTGLVVAPQFLDFELTKPHAGSLAVLLGSGCRALWNLLDSDHTPEPRRTVVKSSWLFDLPMVAWVLMPMVTAWHNGSPFGSTGVAFSIDHALHWGVPYASARLTFRDFRSQIDLLMVIAGLGVLLVPMCLYEMIVGPERYLQVLLFGADVPSEGHAWRLGGWRPHVMFGNGIRLGRWMCVATLACLTLCLTLNRYRLRFLGESFDLGTRSGWIALVLLAPTTLLCRSFSWIYLGFAGAPILLATRRLPRLVGVLLLCAIPIASYGVMAIRLMDAVDVQPILSTVERANQRIAKSWAFRLQSERVYIDMTLDSPYRWFGSNTLPNRNKYPYYSDQRYMMALRNFGLVGLGTWSLTLIAPFVGGVIALLRIPPGEGAHQCVLSYFLLIVALVFWDCLLNAFVNPVFYLSAGLLVSAYASSFVRAR
ncbi:hypothetical protein FYK55_04390 [Roseiconus nitratireducens]|uniref:Oligosaccharide repeat unit polymerase n=1 Tax=Roseiconus nitratireducens TaxID=2605748 RepID=A0A5M6DF00_9BACT|nr:hypothetical protein [Roseiconus nitratireducens]KAA5546141.1 hypothetical protein FYK55_04390 [Roseiconus nitratireducens]